MLVLILRTIRPLTRLPYSLAECSWLTCKTADSSGDIIRATFLRIVTCVVCLWVYFLLVIRNQHTPLLEEKVLERTKELQNSYQIIQKAYYDQRDFITVIINNVKTPLSSMIDSCTRGLENLRVEETQRYLTQLNNTTDQLHQIVNKLADGVVI